MLWWSHLSALGGLNVTSLLAAGVTAWLVAARCWRLALAWCLVFAGAMLVAAASQVAFIGWGIGVRALSFTGFSGHATRAGAVFPVALFLLVERQPRRVRAAAVVAGALLAAAVALARVRVGAHAPSEALSGCVLGLGAAALFLARARAAQDCSPRPLLLGLLAATILLPRADPAYSHQWLTAAALTLSGRDRVYLRNDWQPAQGPYVPPCAPDRVRFAVLCT
ncbi:phosphatase PAP2 family protein [Massilia sp. Root335]|uniref:phosphatase PAP2 family protein n=1 Tax=Massilia sp. Root335 TaxID=1736517 RepID=UPI0006FD74B7|nr:phosphatase PAP2 family protein [Massilia sp. Root335]